MGAAAQPDYEAERMAAQFRMTLRNGRPDHPTSALAGPIFYNIDFAGALPDFQYVERRFCQQFLGLLQSSAVAITFCDLGRHRVAIFLQIKSVVTDGHPKRPLRR